MASPGCQRPFPPAVWTPKDYAALRAAAAQIGCRPEHLLLIMYYETARTVSPAIAFCNGAGYPKAVGLIQFTSAANQTLGITEAERVALLGLSVVDQLPYVVKFFLGVHGGKPFATPPSPATLYQYVAAPGTVGHEVLYTQTIIPCPKPKDATDPYCANISLDDDHDGVITRTDLDARLRKVSLEPRYQSMLAELGAPDPFVTPPPPPSLPTTTPAAPSSSGTMSLVLLGSALGLAGYLVVSRLRRP